MKDTFYIGESFALQFWSHCHHWVSVAAGALVSLGWCLISEWVAFRNGEIDMWKQVGLIEKDQRKDISHD